MDALLSQLPPWLIVVIILVIGGLIVYLGMRAVKEGREVTFWPPHIGPKIEEKQVAGTEKQNESTNSNSALQIQVASELLGLVRAISGLSYGLSIFLTQETRKISFGRSPSNTVILNDSAISQQHFVIKIIPTDQDADSKSNRFLIQLFDLSSANGTMVNRKRVQVVDLQNDDRIQAGGSVFRVYLFE